MTSAIMLVSGTAQAAVQLYTSEAAFTAAHPALGRVDFAGIAADGDVTASLGTPYSHGALTFTSNPNQSAPNEIRLDIAGVGSPRSNSIAFLENNMNANDTANAPFLTTTLNQVSAAGFQVSQGFAGSTGSVGVSVVYAAGAGSPYTTTLLNVGGADSFSFFGIDGLDKISSVTFSLTADPINYWLTAQTLGLAKVLFATDIPPVPTLVPEPGSLLLLASGLLGLAWHRRRAD
jgi:hypothetical protein